MKKIKINQLIMNFLSNKTMYYILKKISHLKDDFEKYIFKQEMF